MDRQQQRALRSCSSLVVARWLGWLLGSPERPLGRSWWWWTLGRWLRGNLDHLEELVGELRDVLEPLGRPFGPRVFAVSLYLARGAVAQTVLELDVHVVYGALIRYRRARGDVVLLLRVDVEDVVEPPEGVFCLGASYWSMFSFLMRSRPLWDASSALLSKSSRIDQRPGLNSRPMRSELVCSPDPD